MSDADADALARRAAEAMWRTDTASQWMGMNIEEVRAGYARLSMPVRPEFLNGHGICHGGFMFTLADSTFAFACNSHNQVAVAAGCAIEFLKPVQGEDHLTAECIEQTLSGRHGIYDVRVTNRAGDVVAMMRGKSAQIKGTLV
jgi:acyl-CoA thioesterase